MPPGQAEKHSLLFGIFSSYSKNLKFFTFSLDLSIIPGFTIKHVRGDRNDNRKQKHNS